MEAVVARKKAEKTVVRKTNGEEVRLVLDGVDRQIGRVIFVIPQHNARFIFRIGQLRSGRVFATIVNSSDRQVVDPEKPAERHLSKTPFWGMARWAWAILTDPRAGDGFSIDVDVNQPSEGEIIDDLFDQLLADPAGAELMSEEQIAALNVVTGATFTKPAIATIGKGGHLLIMGVFGRRITSRILPFCERLKCNSWLSCSDARFSASLRIIRTKL